MAFVSVPRDLSKIKSRLAFNMSKRQLICFGTAAVIGVPTYIFTRTTLGNTGAALLMIGLMLPFFFIAMYEKDGQPAEIVLRNYIRTKIYWPGTRSYRTENLYEILHEEAKKVATENRDNNAAAEANAKAPVGKREKRQSAGKGK